MAPTKGIPIKKRFDGGNATFGESINFGFSKFRLIIAWGLVSATVGVILRILDSLAERFGQVGENITKKIKSCIKTFHDNHCEYIDPIPKTRQYTS